MNLRIGSVPYLNVQPLVYGIKDQTAFCEPAELAERLRAGEFDVGMVPVAEVLAHGRYDIVDGIAITSDGPVASVFLAHRMPVKNVKRVAVTPVSRTSVNLLRVLLKKCHGIEPEFYTKPVGAKLCDHEAMLLIGDEALEYSLKKPSTSRGIWDLGEAWKKLTGLPFVYAVWAMRQDLGARSAPLREILREAKKNGLAHLEDVVKVGTIGSAEFRREYLTRHVRFDLGAAEKRGLLKFQELLAEAGLLKETHELRFVG